MNAIILAAGKGSRMGYDTHKTLLPILGVPNLERTVMFLREFGIIEILIIVNSESASQFEYLKNKYECSIIIASNPQNTLSTMKYVMDIFDDSYVIEGDTVLTHNIFFKPTKSVYFTMKYPNCEKDAWCPILDNNKIIDFKIGCYNEPCLFGISYWSHNDCKVIKKEMIKNMTDNNLNRNDVFWDDCIANILGEIDICVHEIGSLDACEMNTKEEYSFAKKMCASFYTNCREYILKYDFKRCKPYRRMRFIEDIDECKIWQIRLLNHVGNNVNIDKANSIVFNSGEFPFMVYDYLSKTYIGYFDIAESDDYILLRRLFIDEQYRRKGIGTTIIHVIKLYTTLTKKEFRVNVYDEEAERFYQSLNMKLYFKTYKY